MVIQWNVGMDAVLYSQWGGLPAITILILFSLAVLSWILCIVFECNNKNRLDRKALVSRIVVLIICPLSYYFHIHVISDYFLESLSIVVSDLI